MTRRGKGQSEVSAEVEGGQQQRLRECGPKEGKERKNVDKENNNDTRDGIEIFLILFKYAP